MVLEGKSLNYKSAVELLRKYIEEHFEFKDSRERDIVLCWVLGTYYKGFNAYPRLLLHGTKRAGKSKMLTLLSLTCRDAVYGIIPSVSAIFRVIEELKPTLIMDEFNLFSIKDNPELAAVLHAGYKPSGEVLRVEKGKNGYNLCRFPVYCPMALAGLTINDDQLLDRSITINMIRSVNLDIISSRIDENWMIKKKLLKWETLRKHFPDIEHKDCADCMEEIEKRKIVFGRDEELWLPILSVALLLEEKYDIPVYENVLKYCQKSVKSKNKEDMGSFDIKVIAELDQVENLNDFTSSELALVLNREVVNPRETISAFAVGHSLKRLGFEFKNHSGIRHYHISIEDYQKLRYRFGVEDEN